MKPNSEIELVSTYEETRNLSGSFVMNKLSRVLKAIGYAFGTSLAASLVVLLLGACMFGFQFNEWAESEGRLMGVVGTIAGVAGAVVGLNIALRPQQR